MERTIFRLSDASLEKCGYLNGALVNQQLELDIEPTIRKIENMVVSILCICVLAIQKISTRSSLTHATKNIKIVSISKAASSESRECNKRLSPTQPAPVQSSQLEKELKVSKLIFIVSIPERHQDVM